MTESHDLPRAGATENADGAMTLEQAWEAARLTEMEKLRVGISPDDIAKAQLAKAASVLLWGVARAAYDAGYWNDGENVVDWLVGQLKSLDIPKVTARPQR